MAALEGRGSMTFVARRRGEPVRARGLRHEPATGDDLAERAVRPPLQQYRLLRLTLAVFRLGPFLILLGLVGAMAVLSPVFLTTRNLGNVLAQTAVIAVLAVGQLVVILTRGIDLSVGATVALASVVGAIVFEQGHGDVVVIAAMLLAGAAVGFVNGAGFVFGRLPHPFIITLATLSIARGLALYLSGGQPKRGVPDAVHTVGGSSTGWVPYSTF